MNYVIYKPATGAVVSTGTSSQGLAPLYDDLQFIGVSADEMALIDKPSKWRVVNGDLVPAEDAALLVQAKADKWEEIKRARGAAEFGPFTWNGKVFDGDSESQRRLSAAAQLAAQQPDHFLVTWTIADNTSFNLNAQMLSALSVELATQIAGYYGRARNLRDIIEAATTLAAVNAITW